MTGILTDEEINAVSLEQWGSASAANRAYARAIESAVIRKLSAGVSVEPEIKEAKFGGYDAYTAEQFFTAIAAARVQMGNDAINAIEVLREGWGDVAEESGMYRAMEVVRALLGKEPT